MHEIEQLNPLQATLFIKRGKITTCSIISAFWTRKLIFWSKNFFGPPNPVLWIVAQEQQWSFKYTIGTKISKNYTNNVCVKIPKLFNCLSKRLK